MSSFLFSTLNTSSKQTQSIKMVKASFIVMAIATLAVSMASAVGITDSGCHGNELNHNASRDREQCTKQLINQNGVNRSASYGTCKCSANGMTSREAAQNLYSYIKGNMDPRQVSLPIHR
jgi:hypothetical protein